MNQLYILSGNIMCVTFQNDLIRILASEVEQEATNYNSQLDSSSGTCVFNGACTNQGMCVFMCIQECVYCQKICFCDYYQFNGI